MNPVHGGSVQQDLIHVEMGDGHMEVHFPRFHLLCTFKILCNEKRRKHAYIRDHGIFYVNLQSTQLNMNDWHVFKPEPGRL